LRYRFRSCSLDGLDVLLSFWQEANLLGRYQLRWSAQLEFPPSTPNESQAQGG
jgi:hypothetical protein